MKNYFDSFYEIIHKNSVKRRRMVSLLLVLSIFVSSGVLWELHDTVITMVNEPLCGIEEHEHTDECYEKVLVCGLEENEEHTHTEECYENVLVCGHDEHWHTTLCYTGENIPVPDMTEADDDVFALSGTLDSIDGNEEESDEVFLTDLPMIKLNNDIRALANEGELPPTIETIDNIAEGIKFTLFDYGDSELESQNNNYGFSRTQVGDDWVLVSPYDKHNNVKDTGINTGRNINEDIMFFAYGTPIPQNIQPGEGYSFYNWVGDAHYYKPDMNSYSGDYESTPVYSGNRPVSGIVKADLGDDGYPHVAVSDHSLDYLFAPSTNVDGDQSAYKTVYTDVNHLLQKDGNYFKYNSDKNYAYFNTDTKEFDVYNTTYDIINDAHHKDGDVNNIKFDENEQPIVYSGDKDKGFKIGFFPFDQYDESRKDPNYDGNGFNHHFGMTMEASFTNPEWDDLPTNPKDPNSEKKDPVTFKYSGDDDMWVFVDGKLVLDIGGIHEPTGGMIDFTKGLVWVQDNEKGISLDDVKTKIIEWGIITNDNADWEDLPKPIGIDTSSSSSSGNKWIVKPITEFIPDWVPRGNQTHEIKMFYLERGGCYSNLAMEMNLPTLKPLTVKKDVDYQHHYIKDLYDDMDYSFQVWEWDNSTEKWVIPQETKPKDHFYLPENHFTLKAGERKTFEGLGQDRKFKIVEEGVDPNIFEEVTVNDVPTDIINGDASTEGAALSEVNSYTFNNKIAEELTDVTVKKAWDGTPVENFTVKFKIMRTDSVTGEVKQVALQEGDVKKRTFTITSEQWAAGVTKYGLLKRYGNHYYTYSVEELNVPLGYKPSYGADGDVLTITNTDIHKVNINVKKKWENSTGEGLKVKVKLTRTMRGYGASQPTDLTINIRDEMGNLIKTQTISTTDQNKIYTGGSAEIAYVLPKGVELYEKGGYPQKSPDSLGVKFEKDENILVVSNLAESGNVVTFKVTNDKAEDDLLIIHNSFTDLESTNGWTVQNDMSKQTVESEARVITNGSYAKGSALEVYNRTKAFNGAVLYLDPAKFHGNKTYTFSAYVNPNENENFKMTFNNGLGRFDPISDFVSAPAGQWTKITGTLQLPAEIDPYNMFIIIETEPITINEGQSNEDREACRATKFILDEFIAVEGTKPVTVDETTGYVRVGQLPGNNALIYQNDYTGAFSEWSARNGNGSNNDRTEIEHKHEEGSNNSNSWNFDYILVSGRDADSDGMSMSASSLVPGRKYRFYARVQGDGADGADHVQLSINTINKPEGGGEYSNFVPLVKSDPIKEAGNQGNKYVIREMTYDYVIPSYSNQNQMYLYFETEDKSNQKGNFRVHEITITDITEVPALINLPGYDETTGQYVSDYSNYNLVLDENSVTNPLHLLGDGYVPDTGWEREVILESTNDWAYFWKNFGIDDHSDPHYIAEEKNKLYIYHIEEVAILDSNDNPVNMDDYLITYSGNDVATNDVDNPITVTNKYIWYKLPATGGCGTGRIYFFGIVFTSIGIISGAALYRRKRRRV